MNGIRRVKGEALNYALRLPGGEEVNHPALVALHGRGSNADDLIPLGQHLGGDGIVEIYPEGPLEIPLGFGTGYAWYHINKVGTPHRESFLNSLDLLSAFLDRVRRDHGIRTDRQFLLGFSQGATMSYAIALTQPSKVGGVIALSGYVPLESSLDLQWEEIGGMPVFISHGTADNVIPVDFARVAEEKLHEAGAEVHYREHDMGHQITMETATELSEWFAKTIQI